jgi:xylulokinase
MRQLLEIEESRHGRDIDEILVVGGGARSRFWTGVRADITGRRYLRTDEVEAASRGAAMLAAVGAGAHEDAWAAQGAIGTPEAEPVEPTADPAIREVYDRRYRVFIGLYPALRGLFGERHDPARRDDPAGPDDRKKPIGDTGNVAMGGFGTRA